MESKTPSRKRRSLILTRIDKANIIESPENSEIDSGSCRRRSLRLRRCSSVIHPPLSETSDQDKTCLQEENFNPRSRCSSFGRCTCESPISSDSLQEGKSYLPLNTGGSSVLVTSSPTQPTGFGEIRTASTISISPPEWLKPRYSPPRLAGLEVLREERALKPSRLPLRRNTLTENALRFQVFTGQTMEEACLPKYPGAASLDPDLVIKLTRRRVHLRQLKAKRIGFKGLSVSQRTEKRMAMFMRTMMSSSSSPES